MFDTAPHALRHEALLHGGLDEFLDTAVPFVGAGANAQEPVLVMVEPRKIDALRARLGDHERVRYADMREVGRNPARIIPAWREFAEAHPRSPRLHGIGEPVWAGRSDAELAECHLHEALLNVAFAAGPEFRLLCPYDTDALAPDVVDRAHHTHPVMRGSTGAALSLEYEAATAIGAALAAPLEAPPPDAAQLGFAGTADVRRARDFVRGWARESGVDVERAEDLLLAVSEVATNSVRHGGGRGTLRVWREHEAVVCECTDQGRIEEPMVGRRRPARGQVGEWGLWVANQICDLVQIRSSPAGSTVRLRFCD